MARERYSRRKRKPTLRERLKSGLAKIGTLNIVLIIVGAFFVWFNWQMILLYRICGSIPESYACAVVAATIGECGICGWIRTTKDRRRERSWEVEDRKENQKLSEDNGEEVYR